MVKGESCVKNVNFSQKYAFNLLATHNVNTFVRVLSLGFLISMALTRNGNKKHPLIIQSPFSSFFVCSLVISICIQFPRGIQEKKQCLRWYYIFQTVVYFTVIDNINNLLNQVKNIDHLTQHISQDLPLRYCSRCSLDISWNFSYCYN